MWKLLSVLQKNLVWSIPISMAIGLFVGYAADASVLKKFIIPVTFIMVYPMMVTLNVKTIFRGRDNRLQITTQFINFVLIPLLAYYTGKVFFSGGAEKYGLWAVGLFLIGVLPTSGMTISWTGFARGNKEAAIKMVVFGLVLGALAAPVYTKMVMGATIDVDMLHMFKQIALFVFVPLFAGLITQYYGKRKYGLKDWQQRIQPKFPPFSALGVTLIAFVAMSLKARNIIANPGDILTIMVPLVIFYLISYVFLSVTGRLFFKRGDAVAMVFGVVMRDLSIALAIAMTAFGKQGLTIALLIALAYVVQIQSAAWYVRFVDKIFGSAEAETVEKRQPEAAGNPTKVEKLPVRKVTVNETMVFEPMIPDIRRILYATDLSETARYAARYACSIGSKYDADVTVMHVIPDILEELSLGAGIDFADHMDKKQWRDFNKNGIERAQETIHERIRQTSTRVLKEIPRCPMDESNIIVHVGNPAGKILKTLEKGDYDLVIIGTHGHGKFKEAIVGSVAGEVIRKSSTPVMVVRLPETINRDQYQENDTNIDFFEKTARKA